MDDQQSAMRVAQESMRGGPADVAAMLAERVGSRAGVHAIFGQPVERDGVTVIPVGRVRWCFGGGGGSSPLPDAAGEGSGGGGAAMAAPAGFIEIAGGSAVYRRVGFPVAPGTIIAAGVAAYLALRGLRALLR